MNLPSRTALPIFAALFFFSGGAGLIYEVLWMRQFGLAMGNTTVSLSAVLTAFMAGLALGSWAGGRIADWRHDPLRLYGILEILIGLYALAVPGLIGGMRPILASLYRSDPGGWALHGARFSMALGIMVIPTFFMGATLPLLIKRFTLRRDEVGGHVGLIYGINTLGAMAGAFAAGFLLVPHLGIAMTNHIAAAINVLVGVVAMAMGGAVPPPDSSARIEPGPDGAPGDLELLESTAAVRTALLGIAMSGAAAMIYQVCWTRMFALLIGSSAYAFCIVVVANIGGLALGGMMFGRWVDRSRHHLIFFALVQLGVAASAYAIARFSPQYPYLVLQILSNPANKGHFNRILLNEFAGVAMLLFLPTFLMGGMFPVVSRICAGNVKDLGKTIGRVYAFNTVGAVLGSASAALILMNYLGIGATMLVAIAMNILTAFLAALVEWRPPVWLKCVVAAVTLALGAFIASERPEWEEAIMSSGPFMSDRLQEVSKDRASFERLATRSNLLYYRDGVACTVSVRYNEPPFPSLRIAVNGKVEASNQMGDMLTQLLCGHLGPTLRPEARNALVIGLGGGVSLSGVLQHDSIEHVDIVEISSAVVEAVRKHFGAMSKNALDDKRVRLIVADGRNHVLLTDQTYDLIVNVPSNPWMAGISYLFTQEYFEACKDRLSPNGVMCQWIHTYNMAFEDFMMVVKTFMGVMPNALLWETSEGDYLMTGSRTPFLLDWNELKAVVETPKIKDHLDWARLGDPHILVTNLIARKEALEKREVFRNAALNTDDTCRLEFSAPRDFYADYPVSAQAKKMVSLRESPALSFDPATLTPELRQWMDNIPAARSSILEWENPAESQDMAQAVGKAAMGLEMNPYDASVRLYAFSIFREMGRVSFGAHDEAAGKKWLLKALETYESLPFSFNAMEIADTYFTLATLAATQNDFALLNRCRRNIESLGGPGALEFYASNIIVPDMARKFRAGGASASAPASSTAIGND